VRFAMTTASISSPMKSQSAVVAAARSSRANRLRSGRTSCVYRRNQRRVFALSIVLTRDEIYAAFYDDDMSVASSTLIRTRQSTRMRAALATLDLFESANVLEENRRKSSLLRAALSRFRIIRTSGTCANAARSSRSMRSSKTLIKHAHSRGVSSKRP